MSTVYLLVLNILYLYIHMCEYEYIVHRVCKYCVQLLMWQIVVLHTCIRQHTLTTVFTYPT